MTPLRRLLGLTRPVGGWIVLAAAASTAALAANIALMAAAPYLISKAALVTGFSALAVTVTAVRAFAIARAALRYTDRYLSHLVAFRVLTRLRVWLYSVLEPLSPGALGPYRSGDLLARAAADVDTLDGFFVRGLVPPVGVVVATGLACVLLGALDPVLGIGLFVCLALAGIALPLGARRAAKRPAARFIDARADLHATAADAVAGLTDILAFGGETALEEGIGAGSVAMNRPQRSLASVRGWSDGGALVVSGLTGVVLLTITIAAVLAGRIEGVFLASVPLVCFAVFEGVPALADAVRDTEVSRAAAARTFELAEVRDVITEPVTPASLPTGNGLALVDLGFAYPGGPRLLDGVSVSIAGGEHVAIAGPSGAGKTTLVDLVLRFRDPSSGHILLGGVDTCALRSDDVRSRFGVVPQTVYLFNGTLRDNLLLADGQATDEQMLDACERAELGSFIDRLPVGLDTQVGDDGMSLSGGERQRLAIARVFLRDAPILILDEATANLDEDTERRVLERIAEFALARTTLVVSHRPGPLGLADRVVTLG